MVACAFVADVAKARKPLSPVLTEANGFDNRETDRQA